MTKLSSRQKKIWFSLLALLTAATIFVQFFLPNILEDRYLQKIYAEALLKEKTVMAPQGCFHYLEGGEGPTILFIHGFQGDKSYWTNYAKKLVSHYHIVALDLPAHGKTTYNLEGNYDFYSLEKSVEVFCNMLRLQDFHLIGVSMGGGICTILANQHPEWVKSLSLLNPLAVEPQVDSVAQKEISQGINPFFPKNIRDLDHLYTLLLNHQLGWSTFTKKQILSTMLKSMPVYEVCFNQLMANLPFDHLLEKISTRTLILVGEDDQIVHPSSGKVIQSLMRNARLVVLEKGPHTFTGPHLQQAVSLLEEFFQKNDAKSS